MKIKYLVDISTPTKLAGRAGTVRADLREADAKSLVQGHFAEIYKGRKEKKDETVDKKGNTRRKRPTEKRN
jgi:hypothetical protein